jgi:intermembrane space import and assembly protein 40
LEEEAEQQGAFNEETGEINWDCPCLGGMAHGVCGEQFRAAFSCFVYSKEEPKGVECIENFKAMQNCFREHPEIYGSELEEDELAIEAGEGAGSSALEGSVEPVVQATASDGTHPDGKQ